MPRFSLSTVYMAVLASNLLLIVFTLCFRKRKIVMNVGYALLLLFTYCTVLRFLVPLEFSFTQTLILPRWISFFIASLRCSLFHIADFTFEFWHLLLSVWFIGFFVQLIRYLRKRVQTKYNIETSNIDVTHAEPYVSLMEQICREGGKQNCFRILAVEGLTVPALYGVFRPRILIPLDWELSEKDLHYILSHEASHHFHRDLMTKHLVQWICLIYWWNPFSYLLLKQTDLLLEMRIDHSVTRSDQEVTFRYMNCLLNIVTQAYAKKTGQGFFPGSSIPFAKGSTDLEKRFQLMSADPPKRKHFLNFALMGFVFGVYLLSYAFILEAHYMPSQLQEEVIEISTETAYAIEKSDHTYDIYLLIGGGDPVFIENTDSLQYYRGILVYKNEKELSNEKD